MQNKEIKPHKHTRIYQLYKYKRRLTGSGLTVDAIKRIYRYYEYTLIVTNRLNMCWEVSCIGTQRRWINAEFVHRRHSMHSPRLLNQS